MATRSYRNINVRLTEEEAQKLEELQQQLQQEMGDEFKVTQRTVIVQALKQYAQHLAQMQRQRRPPSSET